MKRFLSILSNQSCIFAGTAAVFAALLTAGCAVVPDETHQAEMQDTHMAALRKWAEPAGLKTAEHLSGFEAARQNSEDIETLALAVTTLSGGQRDLRQRVEKLESHLGAEDAARHAAAEEAARYRARVTDFSIKETSSATHIVLTLTDRTDFSAELSGDGKNLTILLPEGTGWAAARQWRSDFSPLIGGYEVAQQNGGERITVRLHFPSKLQGRELIPAAEGGAYRLILPLQSPAIHFSKSR
ncbi:MAG: hypothetical protein EA357_09455 [Micavibrio sp.]|nr:MAG: hypothetical protein EA357_09455 [Micavibrio sp.]